MPENTLPSDFTLLPAHCREVPCLDASTVRSVTDAGLRSLLAWRNRVAALGYDAVLLRASPVLRSALREAGVLRYFRLQDEGTATVLPGDWPSQRNFGEQAICR